jgi:hypothetical protein
MMCVVAYHILGVTVAPATLSDLFREKDNKIDYQQVYDNHDIRRHVWLYEEQLKVEGFVRT